MLMSIAYILLGGMAAGYLCRKVRIPSLFGMILVGILLGPHLLNLLSPNLLDISSQIRQIALIIILIRAGLKLSLQDLKKVGRPAILICFIPASFELIGMVLLAPRLLGVSLLDAAIMGAVVGAVSPAVIVPKMIQLMDEGYGLDKSIPQMILAGASVDDVFVIVLFTSFMSLAQGGVVNLASVINIPLSIFIGVGIGFLIGYLLVAYFHIVSMRQIIQVLVLLALAFTLVSLEDQLKGILPFASLLAVMSMGMMIKKKEPALATKLSSTYDQLWVGAELFLFVLVGASVAIHNALSAGPSVLLLLGGALIFRVIGVACCLVATPLTQKERIFCMLSYTPKATVQAAIGGIPLAMGLASGELILTVSVLAILITAPLGAFAIDKTYQKWLTHQEAS